MFRSTNVSIISLTIIFIYLVSLLRLKKAPKMKQKSRLTIAVKSLLLAAFVLFFTGCEYDYVEPDNVPIDTQISFSGDMVPIFNSSCNFSGCHSSGAVPPDLTPGGAYASLFANNMIDTENPTGSLLYTSMKSGSMKKYATPDKTKIVLAWIEQGGLNN